MRGGRKGKEEEEEMRDGQLEGKRKRQCLVVGVLKKEAKHWEEKREWSDVRKQLGLTSL